MNQSFVKSSLSSKVFDVLNCTFMILFCITILFPLWNMLVMSLSAASDISYLNMNLFPKNIVLDAYKYCLSDPKFYNAAVVTVARTVVGTAYHVLVCSCAAYSLTRTEMPYRKVITFFLLIPMFFSGGLIPTYLNIKNLGLLNNFLVYILPSGFSIYNAIVIRNYFFTIDSAVEEAATVDGASPLRIFFQIILPLSKPVLATVALWTMVGQWNSWFDNLIYIRDEKLLTLQLFLRRLTADSEMLSGSASSFAAQMQTTTQFNNDTIKAATTILVILPIIIVYPLLQKYFVKGIMAGAVKG